MTNRTNILICDADASERERMSGILEDSFCVNALDDPESAVERIGSERPSIVLLAAGPDGDDVQVCRKIAREHSSTKVVMYGDSDETTISAAYANGAVDFLSAPVHPELLMHKMRVCSRLRLDSEIAEIVGRANADMLAEREKLELDRNTMREMLSHSLKHMHARWTQRELRSVKRLMDEYDKRASDYHSSVAIRGDNFDDMRSSPRSDFRVPVTIFLPRPVLTGESLVRVWCRNVSAGGLSFFYNREIRDHEVIVFLEPKNRKPLCCYGTIVRTQKAGHELWEFGVRFANRSTLSGSDKQTSSAGSVEG